MNHGYFQDRLSAYFDQALTPEEMRAIEEHLESCAECRVRLDELAKLDRLVEEKRDLGESDYWENAAQKIESRLTSPEKSKTTDVRSGWFGLGWKLAAAAASIAALTFVTLHEGEIQDFADKSDEASKAVMAPSTTFDALSTSDTGSEQNHDLEDFEAELRPALEPTAERTVEKEKSPELTKAPPTTLVPAESEVAKEVEGKATAEAAWQDADDKRAASEEPDLHTQPVTSVEELLAIPGVVTNADGEIFYRGGRSGEVAYIVDSTPETEEPVYSLVGAWHLDEWRVARDSLQPLIVPLLEMRHFSKNKSMGAAKDQVAPLSLDSPPPPVADSIKPQTRTQLKRYLEACYKIAEWTDRKSEYDSAIVILESYAVDKYSPVQNLARHYLDQLDKLQE